MGPIQKKQQGLSVAVYWSGSKWLTASVPASKKLPGVKFGKHACIHFLPGNGKTLTAKRRQAVRSCHVKSITKLGDASAHRCAHHDPRWKERVVSA